jgi:hypothetical protein
LGIKVTIGEETRDISAREFISACERRGIGIRLDSCRPVCGDKSGQAILDASPELEAAVLLEMAASDTGARDALKERMAILWTEGLPHSAMDAARAMTGR